MGKKVSVRDVAAAAGSSIASVSRALNNTGYVSADLRRRVEHAVQATGYAPSFAARHRRTGRSRAVGFMVSSIANPFLASLFAEVERRMQFAGYALLVASSYDQPAREQELVALFESRQLEGIIASPGVETLPRASNPFAQTALPLVIIDRDIECDGDVVYIDHRTGVRQAVEYLVSLGHTRIALFGPSTALRTGREKVLGYRDGCEAAGIAYDPLLICMSRSSIDSPQAQMADMLRLPSPPTALIGLGTRILSGAMFAARRAGLVIPRDLSVVGIGTEEVFAFMDPPMTSLRFDLAKTAQAVADLMLNRLGAVKPPPPQKVSVPLDLVIGGSCVHPQPRSVLLPEPSAPPGSGPAASR